MTKQAVFQERGDGQPLRFSTAAHPSLGFGQGTVELPWGSLLPIELRLKILTITRTINAQPFNQGTKSRALHPKPSRGSRGATNFPVSILERAKDVFPFSFSTRGGVHLGERRRKVSLLCQFGERRLQLRSG